MAKATGEWHVVDGGALRIRVYKKGTAHLEVHPDMAWRLNHALAHLYPLAIPAQHRQRPARRAKDFPLMQRLLPFEVLDLIVRSLTLEQALEKGPCSSSSIGSCPSGSSRCGRCIQTATRAHARSCC